MTRLRGDWRHTIVGTIIMGIMLFPVYWMVNVSLQSSGAAQDTPWFPVNVTFAGYATAIADQGHNLVTSLAVSVGSVIFTLLIAAPGAYAIALFRIRWAGAVLLALLIAQMIPAIVVANALYSAYNDLGLLNSIGGLIVADSAIGIPFAMLILQTFMKRIPVSIMEAAWVDGAGPLRTFTAIVLPMSRNAIVTSGLFAFLFAWGDFLFALTLTTNENVRPVTLGLYSYVGTYVSDWSPIMATAVLASVPALILLVVAQRYIAGGISAGAVK